MIQASLFDAPVVRLADPPTSHTAAKDIKLKAGSLQAIALRRAGWLCRGGTYSDATANEIAEHDGRVDESMRKRVHELRRRGLLLVVGERKCRVSGKICQAYRVVEHRNSTKGVTS